MLRGSSPLGVWRFDRLRSLFFAKATSMALSSLAITVGFTTHSTATQELAVTCQSTTFAIEIPPGYELLKDCS